MSNPIVLGLDPGNSEATGVAHRVAKAPADDPVVYRGGQPTRTDWD